MKNGELTEHIMLHCDFFRRIWSYLMFGISLNWVKPFIWLILSIIGMEASWDLVETAFGAVCFIKFVGEFGRKGIKEFFMGCGNLLWKSHTQSSLR